MVSFNETTIATNPSYLNVHLYLHKISKFRTPDLDKNYIHPIIRSNITLAGSVINRHGSATSSSAYPKASYFDKRLLV
jgi:hypothetical protein